MECPELSSVDSFGLNLTDSSMFSFVILLMNFLGVWFKDCNHPIFSFHIG